MKTLDDVKQVREDLKRRLQAAHAAALQRGGVILITAAERARFEEACVLRPSRHSASPSRFDIPVRDWIRC